MKMSVSKRLDMQKHFFSEPKDITLPISQYYDRHNFVLKMMEEAKDKCGVKLLAPVPYLCPDGKVCMGSMSGESLYGDDNHLNNKGDALLSRLFEPLFNQHP